MYYRIHPYRHYQYQSLYAIHTHYKHGPVYCVSTYIITDFYQLNYNKELPPFDEVQAYSIYTRTLERYTTLASDS